MNYYIFITTTGKRIPVKTRIKVKTVQIANCFYEENISCFYPIDLLHYFMEGGKQ